MNSKERIEAIAAAEVRRDAVLRQSRQAQINRTAEAHETTKREQQEAEDRKIMFSSPNGA